MLCWGEFRKQDGAEDTAVGRLVLTKQAISEVTWAMHLEGANGQARDANEKLGVSIKALRALEHGHGRLWHTCVEQHGALSSMGACRSGVPCAGAVIRLKVEPAGGGEHEVQERDLGPHTADEALNLHGSQRGRRRGVQIETQPGPIVEGLRKHWGEVFKGT
jgi:hypothetical protein